MIIAGYLVWVRGQTSPKKPRRYVVAEKWPVDPIDAAKHGKTVLATHPLTAEQFAMPIAILEQRFPAPEFKEDA